MKPGLRGAGLVPQKPELRADLGAVGAVTGWQGWACSLHGRWARRLLQARSLPPAASLCSPRGLHTYGHPAPAGLPRAWGLLGSPLHPLHLGRESPNERLLFQDGL